MNPSKTATVIVATFASAALFTGCADTKARPPEPATSSTSATPSATDTPSPTIELGGAPNLDELAGGQFKDFVSVIDYPTLYDESIAQLFEASSENGKGQEVTHKEVAFNVALDVVSNQTALEPNLGGKPETPQQPEGSPMTIADASDVVDNYFSAVMSALETGDASQLGKITSKNCILCADTELVVEEAANPKTYENAQVYSGGLVFPNSTLEFVRTDGMYYHFKAAAVERKFLSNLNIEPWIMRAEDAGNFVMDIIVAETNEGWKMVFYDVTPVE